jgi:hypothetical protein
MNECHGIFDVKQYCIDKLFPKLLKTFVKNYSQQSKVYFGDHDSIVLGKIVKLRMEEHKTIDSEFVDKVMMHKPQNEKSALINNILGTRPCISSAIVYSNSGGSYSDDDVGFYNGTLYTHSKYTCDFELLSNLYLRELYKDKSIPDFFDNEDEFEEWIFIQHIEKANQTLLDTMLDWKNKIEKLAASDLDQHSAEVFCPFLSRKRTRQEMDGHPSKKQKTIK